ncbi:DUF317 domain-containing protein [Streptomyces mirabilis]|uniref:DUF317 domain-containing protein n=1 Tax=Streptomyces mirabilis TaxID=68239 RepID=UPI003D9E5C5C
MPDSADNALVSPDRIAYVQRLGSAEEPGAWFVTSTLGLDRPVWQARFGAHPRPSGRRVHPCTGRSEAPSPHRQRAQSADPRPERRHPPGHGRARRVRRRRAGRTRSLPRCAAQHRADGPDPLAAGTPRHSRSR